jgi:hypothetical protein
LMNLAIPCGDPMCLGVVNAWRTIPASMCRDNSKLGGVGIRVWGCFSWNGFRPLVILQGNLNSKVYNGILTPCVLSTVGDQSGGDDCLYQHDSAPCHKARTVREWFVDNKVPEMDWPAQIPNPNRRKHLWDELVYRQITYYLMPAECHLIQ